VAVRAGVKKKDFVIRDVQGQPDRVYRTSVAYRYPKSVSPQLPECYSVPASQLPRHCPNFQLFPTSFTAIPTSLSSPSVLWATQHRLQAHRFKRPKRRRRPNSYYQGGLSILCPRPFGAQSLLSCGVLPQRGVVCFKRPFFLDSLVFFLGGFCLNYRVGIFFLYSKSAVFGLFG